MIKSVNNYPVSQLLDTETNVVFRVPRYQREYSWGKVQWESLFDDLIENAPGYFLGSLICVNQSDDSLAVQELELIDGQQRLTTLSLLFAAIYSTLKAQDTELDDEQRVEMINLKHRLVLKRDKETLRLLPQIQNNNQRDYRYVLAKSGVSAPQDPPSYVGIRRVQRTYLYFQDRLEKLAAGEPGGVSAILNFLDKVSKANLVKIEVASHADAYTLFESLNNRGMALTAIDLIKNKLLATLEKEEQGSIDTYFSHWQDVLAYLGDDYATQERFFRQYYNAFRNELKTVYQVPMATRSNLMMIYEKLISVDAKGFLERVKSASRRYGTLLLRVETDNLAALEKPLKDLDRVQGAPAYLLLLYLLTLQGELQLSSSHLARIVTLLVSFFVRRNLTDTPPTRDLTRIFMGIIDTFGSAKGDEAVEIVHRQLLSLSASDEAFMLKLEGNIYEENTSATRFILSALAEQSMTRETWVDLWRMDNKHFVWTIEHVFPQGENIPQSWVDMMAEGDFQEAKRIQQSHVHKLGNLTISGFNATLGNRSYQEKRERTDREGRSVGYNNGLKLNEDLSEAESWNVDRIDARTAKLVEQTMRLFDL